MARNWADVSDSPALARSAPEIADSKSSSDRLRGSFVFKDEFPRSRRHPENAMGPSSVASSGASSSRDRRGRSREPRAGPRLSTRAPTLAVWPVATRHDAPCRPAREIQEGIRENRRFWRLFALDRFRSLLFALARSSENSRIVLALSEASRHRAEPCERPRHRTRRSNGF
jgi:hypothetical protein